jgi:hypothetical protein
VTGRLLLLVFFYVVVTPVALVRRVIGGDPMRHPLGDRGYWAPVRTGSPDGKDMRRPS